MARSGTEGERRGSEVRWLRARKVRQPNATTRERDLVDPLRRTCLFNAWPQSSAARSSSTQSKMPRLSRRPQERELDEGDHKIESQGRNLKQRHRACSLADGSRERCRRLGPGPEGAQTRTKRKEQERDRERDREREKEKERERERESLPRKAVDLPARALQEARR